VADKKPYNFLLIQHKCITIGYNNYNKKARKLFL